MFWEEFTPAHVFVKIKNRKDNITRDVKPHQVLDQSLKKIEKWNPVHIVADFAFGSVSIAEKIKKMGKLALYLFLLKMPLT
mmetsp:Transcript_77648/g.116781  ORF Transcript_77648/g.116781 Transcript_77648/m.116781 type:complete len:81 (-) Transcript_77648:575-817(-)